jgi:hypothetical protein
VWRGRKGAGGVGSKEGASGGGRGVASGAFANREQEDKDRAEAPSEGSRITEVRMFQASRCTNVMRRAHMSVTSWFRPTSYGRQWSHVTD